MYTIIITGIALTFVINFRIGIILECILTYLFNVTQLFTHQEAYTFDSEIMTEQIE